jgi:peptidoglycan hydrolase-like protein with peptidoglycan-binding domain
VRVVEVHETLIEIHPEWRGQRYFVVREDIIIVDRDQKIVAVVPMGSSSAQSSSSQFSSDSSGSMNLSQDEIRQLQIALNQKGFNIGEPDGVLGPRTRNALIQFQQRQGFQATGQIDQRTVAALGLSMRGQQGMQQGQQGMPGQPSSTAQPGDRMQQPSANQAGQQGTTGGSQPSTAGQAGERMQQPSGNQGAETGQGNTSGQPTPRPPHTNPNSGGGALMRGEQGR